MKYRKKKKMHNKKDSMLEQRIRKVEKSNTTLREWLKREYVNLMQSLNDIARKLSKHPYEFDISSTTIGNYLNKYEISIRAPCNGR